MRALIYVAILLLCTSACTSTPKVKDLPDTSSEATPMLAPDTLLAQFVGNAHEGATQTFTGTRFGNATVTAGRSYHSALNIPCREAYVHGTFRTKISVCKDEKYGWTLAPEILGEGAL